MVYIILAEKMTNRGDQLNEKELQRLIRVSQLYYEENKTQDEIAKVMKVSRPLVSNILNKARKEGIIKINILSYLRTNSGLSNELCQRFKLDSCQVVSIPDDLYQIAANVLLEFLPRTRILGLGWGYNINKIIKVFPQQNEKRIYNGIICPLIGATNAPQCGYHPNELVKELSQRTGFEAKYLNSPAFPTNGEEQKHYLDTDNYKQIHEYWKKITTALITLGSFPSVPDHGSELRFGKKLLEEKAVGNLLSYFFNPHGELIQGEDDFAIQIPMFKLKQIKNVIGFVPQEANVSAITSGLKTGTINHLVISEQIASEIIECNH